MFQFNLHIKANVCDYVLLFHIMQYFLIMSILHQMIRSQIFFLSYLHINQICMACFHVGLCFLLCLYLILLF